MTSIISKARWCLVALFISSVSVVSCKKDDKENSSEKSEKISDDDESSKKKKKKSESDDDDESPKKKKKSESDDTFEKVGIKVCDDYLEKMLACYKSNKNMPKSAIETQKDALMNVAKIWRNAVVSGGAYAKQGIEAGCKTAMKTAKESMKEICKELQDDE